MSSDITFEIGKKKIQILVNWYVYVFIFTLHLPILNSHNIYYYLFLESEPTPKTPTTKQNIENTISHVATKTGLKYSHVVVILLRKYLLTKVLVMVPFNITTIDTYL